jgi:hypothetical protein
LLSVITSATRLGETINLPPAAATRRRTGPQQQFPHRQKASSPNCSASREVDLDKVPLRAHDRLGSFLWVIGGVLRPCFHPGF